VALLTQNTQEHGSPAYLHHLFTCLQSHSHQRFAVSKSLLGCSCGIVDIWLKINLLFFLLHLVTKHTVAGHAFQNYTPKLGYRTVCHPNFVHLRYSLTSLILYPNQNTSQRMQYLRAQFMKLTAIVFPRTSVTKYQGLHWLPLSLLLLLVRSALIEYFLLFQYLEFLIRVKIII